MCCCHEDSRNTTQLMLDNNQSINQSINQCFVAADRRTENLTNFTYGERDRINKYFQCIS